MGRREERGRVDAAHKGVEWNVGHGAS
jgi:hypothetical protein